jgi:hypothetical protein
LKPTKKLNRGKLQSFMEKTSLPISLDRAKHIERDDFFKVGGTYRSQMNPYNSKVEDSSIKKNRNLRV